MSHYLVKKTFQSRLFGYTSLFVMLFTVCLVSSCSDYDPVVIVEPDTFVYLVTLNDESDLHSLTIVDFLDGTGSMIVPDIPAHPSSNFHLIIDRIDENNANISASQPEINVPFGKVKGAGFFTRDSIYIEFTIDGFSNRDIITGSR